MIWKKAARIALHRMGGLEALRLMRRNQFRILMFHEFQEPCRANLEAVCDHISRHFEPVPISSIADAVHGKARLPSNALTVTVDDGYKNFLLHGHPVFRRYRIPTTIYAVAGFSDGQLWLWTDHVEFGLRHTAKHAIRAEIDPGAALDLDLSSPESRTRAAAELCAELKKLPNDRRRRFISGFGALCGVDIPSSPPADRMPLNWEELRALAAEGVEIGCHTFSHPILSRVCDSVELDHEIRGAKELMESRLGLKVNHFCYPNGRDADISDAAVDCVRRSGYESSVTTTYGLNTLRANPLRIMRLPFDDRTDTHYAAELLAGLHL